MRSGTIHRLHISEFGKICAKVPEKAAEVMTGSIPAVPASGILVFASITGAWIETLLSLLLLLLTTIRVHHGRVD